MVMNHSHKFVATTTPKLALIDLVFVMHAIRNYVCFLHYEITSQYLEHIVLDLKTQSGRTQAALNIAAIAARLKAMPTS